jgi:hypothetical protein
LCPLCPDFDINFVPFCILSKASLSSDHFVFNKLALPGILLLSRAGILQTEPLPDTTFNEGTGQALLKAELSSKGFPALVHQGFG